MPSVYPKTALRFCRFIPDRELNGLVIKRIIAGI
jgi:hypothetical protein